MNMPKKSGPEVEIFNAAQKLFLKKGYNGTSLRDIATEANTSNTMVNYYYRSKDKLFIQVFGEVFSRQYSKFIAILLDSDIDIYEKINKAVAFYGDFLRDDPSVAIFLIREINRDPAMIGKCIQELTQPELACFLNDQIQNEICQGRMRDIPAHVLVINLLSLCIFPVIAKPIIQNAICIDDIAYSMQQKAVADFLIKSILP